MTHTVTHTRKCLKRVKDHRIGNPVVFFAFFLVSGNCFAFEILHHLRHNLAHGDCCGVLCLSGGVRVGAEGKSSVVVTQHGGNGLHIHTVLQRCRGKRVPELMKFQVWEFCVLQNLFMDVDHRVGMVYSPGNGRWEQVGSMVCSVMKVNGLLRDGHQPDRVFRFRLGEDAFYVGVALNEQFLISAPC